MPRVINPRQIARPPSRHSHAIVHNARSHRMVIAAQVGLRPDGTMVEGVEGQMLAAWDNILAILAEGGMGVPDLIKVCVFVTAPGSVAIHRSVLARVLGGHAPAVSYMEVQALAQPDFLVAIDAEAVSEEGVSIFDEIPEISAGVPRFRGAR